MQKVLMLIAILATIVTVSLASSITTINDENREENSIVMNGFDDDRDIPEFVNC